MPTNFPVVICEEGERIVKPNREVPIMLADLFCPKTIKGLFAKACSIGVCKD